VQLDERERDALSQKVSKKLGKEIGEHDEETVDVVATPNSGRNPSDDLSKETCSWR
jgi:hypothetical protein